MLLSAPIRQQNKKKKAFTLIEMLVVFLISTIVLGLIFDLHHTGLMRFLGVSNRIEGEQAVRILLTRIRHELRSAIGLIRIDQNGQQFTIPLRDNEKTMDNGSGQEVPLIYQMQYQFDSDSNSVQIRRLDAAGSIVWERPFLGGDMKLHSLFCMDTSENNRILFQYYRVILELEYYDIKLAKKANTGGNRKIIHTTCTVYPRFINQELRIEVPQEGGAL